MTSARALLAVFDWRSVAVFRRNALVFLRNWRTGFIPPALEPVFYFLAFGLGLATYVGGIQYDGGSIRYVTYIAPGMIAYTAFITAFYEALYAAYVRMFYQNTWDGLLATQIELPHVVWGEVLWSACRGAVYAAIVGVVIAGFDIGGFVDLHLGWLPLIVALAFLSGLAFAAAGLIFTALVPAIDHMNYPVFLIGVPLSLASNTYFPVPERLSVVRWLMNVNPVYHLAETARAMLVLGRPGPHLGLLLCTGAVWLVLCSLIAIRLTRRRVLGT
ncbi:MAG: ABC transporter permease [Myxococcales bacterium]|nr:ABC transporter permease [Myxococcales bacterium]